jgi:hypothetical protein
VQYLYSQYRKLLGAFIAGGYRIVTVREAARERIDGPFVILRHDVEWQASRAVAIAEVEASVGVCSTLYVRADTHAFDTVAMRGLQEQGFDIGYHYNALDRASGDFERARSLFEEELRVFREEGLEVTSATPHGDPMVRRRRYTSNSDLMKRYPELLEACDLVDIGRFGTRFPLQEPVLHVSDANMRWNRGELTWPFFFRITRERSVPRLFMLVHADYWSGSRVRARSLHTAAWAMRALRLRSSAPRFKEAVPKHRVAAPR